MLHDGNAAAAEFQKFIDHRGLVVNFPWGALARLGLARAYALQGEHAQSPRRLSGFPHPLERRRSRCSDPAASQSGVREAEVSWPKLLLSHFILSQLNVRVTFTPSRVVVLNVIAYYVFTTRSAQRRRLRARVDSNCCNQACLLKNSPRQT